MDKRSLYRASIFGIAFFVCGYCLPILSAAHYSALAGANPPNIILIHVDDMGWRDVGFMGSRFYRTPHIDALAAQGMIFMQGYASAANCAPSRACLMSGKWSPRHGIYTVASSERGKAEDRKLVPTPNETTLSDEHMIIPEILGNHGYVTCHAGKWHLHDDPLTRGFDYNIGGGHNGHPASYYAPYNNISLEAEEGKHLTDLIMEKTVAFLEATKEPFFLNYAPYAIHTPIQGIDSLSAYYQSQSPWKGQSNIAYATMIHNLDRNIGHLITTLKNSGKWSNTLIIFTSDNGGVYGITQQQPLRAGKGSYYEGGIRVPFFFVWNDRIAIGQDTATYITNLDLFPTILEAAGVSHSSFEYDGHSLLSLLSGEEEVAQTLRPLYWHFPIYLQAYDVHFNQSRDPLFRTRPGSVIRYGDWKLHHYFEDNGLELYHLGKDVGEQDNVVDQYPQKVKELMRKLDEWRKKTAAPVPTTLNPAFVEN